MDEQGVRLFGKSVRTWCGDHDGGDGQEKSAHTPLVAERDTDREGESITLI